jgi:hypothetical protein
MRKLTVAALLLLAVPALAEDSQTRLEDILSGKADEKKEDRSSTTNNSGSSSSSSSSSGSSSSGSSLVSSGPIAQNFSLLTGKTVGSGKNVLGGNYKGLLGVEGFFLHGVSDAVDIGARVGIILYPFEGALPIAYYQGVNFGMRIQGLLRIRFVESGRISFGINFEPGFFFYFPALNFTQFGILLGVDAQIGIAVSSALNIALGIKMPVFISIGAGTGGVSGIYRYNPYLCWPILGGGGIEYFIRSDLMLFGSFHIGPMINLGNYGGAGVGMDLKFGIGWKF